MVDVALSRADAYEACQEWPSATSGEVAAILRAAAPGARSAHFLGCATGVNDALPFARLAPGVRVTASDVDPDFLRALAGRAEALPNVEVRRVDLRSDLDALPRADLVAMFFVIHRLEAWEAVVPGLARLVAPGGRFFASEFAGPDGVVYRSNEAGGSGGGVVARLLRRCAELRPEPFAPRLKSTEIRPFLDALGRELAYAGARDVAWRQSITVGELLARIEAGAYAPFFDLRSARPMHARLREEFGPLASVREDLVETIRLHEFRRA